VGAWCYVAYGPTSAWMEFGSSWYGLCRMESGRHGKALYGVECWVLIGTDTVWLWLGILWGWNGTCNGRQVSR